MNPPWGNDFNLLWQKLSTLKRARVPAVWASTLWVISSRHCRRVLVVQCCFFYRHLFIEDWWFSFVEISSPSRPTTLFEWPSNEMLASLCLLKVGNGAQALPFKFEDMQSIFRVNQFLFPFSRHKPLSGGSSRLNPVCLKVRDPDTQSAGWGNAGLKSCLCVHTQIGRFQHHVCVCMSWACWKFTVVWVNFRFLRRQGCHRSRCGWEASRCSSPSSRSYESYSSEDREEGWSEVKESGEGERKTRTGDYVQRKVKKERRREKWVSRVQTSKSVETSREGETLKVHCVTFYSHFADPKLKIQACFSHFVNNICL